MSLPLPFDDEIDKILSKHKARLLADVSAAIDKDHQALRLFLEKRMGALGTPVKRAKSAADLTPAQRAELFKNWVDSHRGESYNISPESLRRENL